MSVTSGPCNRAREIIMMLGVGHTPPEERPEEINVIVLKFLKDIGF
jgi:pimeloyl-ACP methyl ester carboxylesterase